MCVCVPLTIIVCASLFATIQLVGVGLLEELDDGGVASARGLHKSRFAILNAQRERR